MLLKDAAVNQVGGVCVSRRGGALGLTPREPRPTPFFSVELNGVLTKLRDSLPDLGDIESDNQFA